MATNILKFYIVNRSATNRKKNIQYLYTYSNYSDKHGDKNDDIKINLIWVYYKV